MPNKIDSNFTGLRYAEESAVLGVLPASPVWNPLEPNSYNDFGAQITTLARTPIEPSRQRKKGVITDLDSVAGFQSDFTQNNFFDLMQGFFFALWAKTPSQVPTAVSGTVYTVPSTAVGWPVGAIALASGFSVAGNNGFKRITAVTSTTLAATGLAIETPGVGSTPLVKVVGQQFASAAMNVANLGATSTYTIGGLTAASKALTITTNATNNDTVTIGTRVYTFKTTLTGAADEIKIGASATATGDNMVAALAATAGQAGILYGVGTAVNALVTGVNAAGVVTVTAIVSGASGNSIAIAEAGTNLAWAGAAVALSGGVGLSFLELGIIPGEWIFVGGDAAGTKFVNAGNNGFARVLSITNTVITIDKTIGTPVTETGTGLTIDIYFGDTIKNEANPDLIVRKSYQFERALSTAGYEYALGCVANTLKLDVQTASKITAELGFISTDSNQSLIRAAGSFPTAVSTDAFNTSSDFARLRLAKKSTVSTPLFVYVSELSLSINNNVSPNKAVSVLGAFDLTAGNFTVEGNLEAYFADIAAVQAVRQNADVTIDFSFRKNNAGWVFDVPLIALGDGRLKVEKDQPIKIPLSMAAAADQTFNHTLLAVSFPYLPNAA